MMARMTMMMNNNDEEEDNDYMPVTTTAKRRTIHVDCQCVLTGQCRDCQQCITLSHQIQVNVSIQ